MNSKCFTPSNPRKAKSFISERKQGLAEIKEIQLNTPKNRVNNLRVAACKSQKIMKDYRSMCLDEIIQRSARRVKYSRGKLVSSESWTEAKLSTLQKSGALKRDRSPTEHISENKKLKTT